MARISEFMKIILHNFIFQLTLRLFLGGSFIVASIPKLIHPTLFAEAIYSYQLLPMELVNLMAAVLAMLELIIGITLIIGIWTRESSLIISGLTVVFIVAISINMIRGLEISCGCFDVISDAKIGIDLLIRDFIYLAAGILIITVREPRFGFDQLFRSRKLRSQKS